MRECKYEVNLMSHPTFEVSRGVLATRRAELFGMGLGNKPNKAIRITDEQIEKCWATGAFGATDPRSLQATIYYYFCQAFGWRPRDEPFNCQWQDLVIKQDEETRYIEWNERASKTRKGQTNMDPRQFNPKLWELGTDRCILPLFELFTSKRPDSHVKAGVKVFLTPKPKTALATHDVCYSREEMGINSVGAIMKRVATKAKLYGNVKGHSVRRTGCTNLLQENVAPNIIAQWSGHASLQSLQHYTTASMQQQHEMSDILVGGKRPATGIEARKAPSKAPSAAASVAPVDECCDEEMCPEPAAAYRSRSCSPAACRSSVPAARSASSAVSAATPPRSSRAPLGPSHSAMFYGATFNGPVNFHMHYGNVSSQAQINHSPLMSASGLKASFPIESGLDGHHQSQ